MAHISKIRVGTTTYDINAVTLAGKTLEEILASGNTAVFTLSDSAETTPDVTSYHNGSIETKGLLTPENANSNSIYLVAVYEEGSLIYYNEYIVISNTWALLGTTNIDLAGYVKDGNYPTESATSTTDEYAGETITTQASGGSDVEGTVTIEYDKATLTSAPVGNFSQPENTGNTKPTATGSFTGNEVTITPTVTVAGHSHTITPSSSTTITYVTGVSLTGDGSHSHNIEGLHTHESKAVVEEVTPESITIPHVTGATSADSGSHSHPISASSGTIASVSGTVLTLRAEAITYINSNTDDAGSHSHTITVSSTDKNVVGSITTTKVNVANPGSATILTTLGATHTHTVSASTTTETFMTGGTISSETPIATVEGVKYTPTGSVSVSVGEHRHTYNAPIAHTHKISGYDRIEETFDLKAYVLAHSHEVTIPKHSHNVNGHSHVVKLK